jgi:hypothetical protein
MLTDYDRQRMRALERYSANALAALAEADWSNPYDPDRSHRNRRAMRVEQIAVPPVAELDYAGQSIECEVNYCPLGMASFEDGLLNLANRGVLAVTFTPSLTSTVFPDHKYGLPDAVYVTGVICSKDFAAIHMGAVMTQDEYSLRSGVVMTGLPWWHDLFMGRAAIDDQHTVQSDEMTFSRLFAEAAEFIKGWDAGMITPSMLVDYAKERA